MALKYFAYIYLSSGFSPEKNTITTESEHGKFKAVGIDFLQKEKIIEVAKSLVAEGVQMIEICGGFGPTWISKISEAINNVIPIGGVYYGPEWRQPLLDIVHGE